MAIPDDLDLAVLGFSHDKSEDFCTTILGMLLQHSPSFAERVLSSILEKAAGKVTWPTTSRIRVSGQECIEQYLPGCIRFPDLWIRCFDETGAKPRLIVVEVKVGSGESNGQMADYRRFVDHIHKGVDNTFSDALLVFLSFCENPRLSALPDVILTWQRILELMEDHLKTIAGFEASFTSAVYRHLRLVKDRYVSRPPLGSADDFVAMLQGLPTRYEWLEYIAPRPNGVQHTVVPAKNHPWIRARLASTPGISSALIGVNPHRKPHLDSFPESWLKVLLPPSEDVSAWRTRITRVKDSIPDLQEAIEDVLLLMDDRRKRECE